MSIRPRFVVLISMGVAGVVGFFIGGDFLYRAAIGLDPSAFPAGPLMQKLGLWLFPGLQLSVAGLVLALGSVLLMGLAAAGAVFASTRSARRSADPERRSFLVSSLSGAGAGLAAVAAGGSALYARAFAGVGNEGRGWGPVVGEIFGGQAPKTHPDWKQEWRGSRIRGYRTLGRTGWRISDIVLGTGPLSGEQGEKVARLAIERGINYIDTAPDYSAAGSEQAVGRAIKGRVRDDLFLATKFCTPTGHLPPGTPVEVYKSNLEDSLRRLGTDRVDLVHIHSCDEIDRLMDENMHEAFDRLKAEGKVRFLGFSSHTPNLVQVANRAIESGRFDVMMLAYHHGIWSELSDVIARARREQNMGVVAMKTLKGAKHRGLENFQPYADAYSQAALRWTLSNPHVSCAVISFTKPQHVDEYLFASGKRMRGDDLALLQRYDQEILNSYCAPHCGACLDSCPEQLPIHDILRHRMYFEDYGWEKEGMRRYAALEKNASVCASCPAPCMGSCPLGIPIRERTTGAHELLTFG